jgi:hypothetical protein
MRDVLLKQRTFKFVQQIRTTIHGGFFDEITEIQPYSSFVCGRNGRAGSCQTPDPHWRSL